MVSGTGMMAGVFSAYRESDRFLVFARGVSDSRCSDPAPFERERATLQAAIDEHPEKTVVYFSTLSLHDPEEREGRYVTHKLGMERLLFSLCPSAIVFRLPQLVGRTSNRQTLVPFLIGHISDGKEFSLWEHATRNILDAEDAYTVMDHLLRQYDGGHRLHEIASPVDTPVPDLVRMIEDHLGRKARYHLLPRGGACRMDHEGMQGLYRELGLLFGQDYIPRVLEKYYPGGAV